MNRRVLITGFGPFGGVTKNPSSAIAEALDGRRLGGSEVAGKILPVDFAAAPRELRRAIRETEPVMVVCLGVAASRSKITPERVAVNLQDAPIPDNAGFQPVDSPILKNGAAAYFSTLPIKNIVAHLAERGAPVAISDSAGQFVCNHVFYHLMRVLRRTPQARGGFIHVPLPRHGFTIDDQVAAIAVAVRVASRCPRKTASVAGRID